MELSLYEFLGKGLVLAWPKYKYFKDNQQAANNMEIKLKLVQTPKCYKWMGQI